MQLSWLGLSSFHLLSKHGQREVSVVIDPFENSGSLRFPRTLEADLVLDSHEGPQASNHEAVLKNPFVVSQPGEYEVGGVGVYAIDAPRSKPSHPKGSVTHRLFCLEVEEMRLVHLGALDRLLTDEELSQLKDVDILCVPVGGGAVLSPKEAVEVVGQIEPRIVIPMLYALEGISLSLGPLADFTKALGSARREDVPKWKGSRKDLPEEDQLLVVLSRA